MNLLIPMEPTFTAPQIDWVPLVPVIIVLGGAVIGVLIEAFASVKHRRVINIVWSLLVVAAAFVTSVAESKMHVHINNTG